MDRPFEGQTALITGASRGIGRAIAEALAARGADVAAVARRTESCADTCAAVAALGRTARAYAADVSDRGAIAAAVDQAAAEFGRLDLLINNAGLARDGLFVRMSAEQWSEVIRVNLLGVIHATESAIVHFGERGGAIVNIASVAGLRGNPGQVNYAAAKAGVIGYTRAIAPPYARRGIRVNCVIPGLIETDLTEGYSDRLKAEGRSRVALGRFGTVAEVAHLVAWVCSPEASYVVGSVIEAHGGLDA